MIVKRHEADAKGAVEADFELIDVIEAAEVLGYQGRGREEHSGETSPESIDELEVDILEEVGASR
ncbi:MAG: hypothetical protein NDJ92_10860 [Thermoanaerobaculia bacterium]|nr:hypothetical protein [Thermoanaerobaculia bacterium]